MKNSAVCLHDAKDAIHQSAHLNATTLREAILASLAAEVPSPGTLYIPPSHRKALSLYAHVVTAPSGSGKSFLVNARDTWASINPELDGIEVHVGFAEQEAFDNYPNADAFKQLLDERIDAYDVWRAVILRWIAKRQAIEIPVNSWGETIGWLKQQPEQAARLIQSLRVWRGLIIFDALDRLSNDRKRMDDLVRGLLRAVLWLRPFKFQGLFGKVFLDEQSDRTVFNFPDSSKLVAYQVNLSWDWRDLHGLLWQRLINAEGTHGEQFRSLCVAICQRNLLNQGGIWSLPDEIRRDNKLQKKLFKQLAGPFMGVSAESGIPYTWLSECLADAQGRFFPRTFMTVIKVVTEDSRDHYPSATFALHYESIKLKASCTRN